MSWIKYPLALWDFPLSSSWDFQSSDHSEAGVGLQEGDVEHCLQHVRDWWLLQGRIQLKCFELAILPAFHIWEEQ